MATPGQVDSPMRSAPSPRPRRDPPRKSDTTLLGNRNFVLLWAAYGVSAMGDHLSEMALLKSQGAHEADTAATLIDARMTFLLFVPFFLLGPIMGLLADRFSRRRLMILADLVRCGLMFFFLSLSSWTTGLGSWGPLLPILFVGVFAALFSPARAAMLPTLIRRDQLVRANGMMAGLGIIATMAAILIGGYLVQYFDVGVSFKLDSATYLVSALILFVLIAPKRRHASAERRRPAFRELADGFRYVWCHRRVMELLGVAALVWFCGPLVKCVIPAVVLDVYGGDYTVIGLYRAYLGLGFILGAIIISVLGDALHGEIAITWGLFGIGAGIAVFAASVFLPFDPVALKAVGAVGVVMAGVFGLSVMASLNALLQRIVPDRFRGRVYGVKEVCCVAALLTATGSLGMPGWTDVDRWVGYILIGVAVLAALAGLITLWVRLNRSPLGRSLTFAENLNEFIAKFWWRMKRIGPSTIPHEGPVIVTANHRCSADPLFLHAAAPYRAISFMVAAEYTTSRIARFFFNLVDSIPVKRDGQDMGPTKQAIRHLRAGKAVGIFIQGGVVPPGEPSNPKDGVAMLALKTGAKVIPAHISGVTFRESVLWGLLCRHRVRVRFGPPVDLTAFDTRSGGREVIRAATQRICAAIEALAPEEDPEWTVVPRTAKGHTSEPNL